MGNAVIKKDVFPEVFCLEDIQCTPNDTGGYSYRAALYHDQACITVSFDCAQRDPQLKKGRFVSVRWLSSMQSDHGAIHVAGLTACCSSIKDFNPFLTVPHTWSIDRHLINCARDLWDVSSNEMRRLLLATFMGELRTQGSNGLLQHGRGHQELH